MKLAVNDHHQDILCKFDFESFLSSTNIFQDSAKNSLYILNIEYACRTLFDQNKVCGATEVCALLSAVQCPCVCIVRSSQFSGGKDANFIHSFVPGSLYPMQHPLLKQRLDTFIIFQAQVLLRTEVLRTPSSTPPWFELMTSKS